MYGSGPGKVGRGGSSDVVRRRHSSFHSQPVISRRGAVQTDRNSIVGGSVAPPARPPSAPSKASHDVEQTFSLVTRNSPLSFAAIIRLAPNLIDDIKRIEAQGGAARIKFDAIANNPDGNVIEVAGKDFKFTWSDDKTALCDIYEERQSGVDGNGLLVESACVQRNVNVQRILDESAKNHVKMRSEEAEKKLKSRKAIVLDPANPSMKNQMKAIAAVDANPWKSGFRQKKEPPLKKRKSEPLQVSTKTIHKTGPVAAVINGRSCASPLCSPPEQLGALASPLGAENLGKAHIAMDTSVQELNKVSAVNLKKHVPNKTATSVKSEKMGHKGKVGASSATSADLQSMLIALLMENHKGMTLKALEKAIRETIPSSVKKIEPIIKRIATFQAPGRYFLKQGVNLDSFKKPLLSTESSPEIKQQKSYMEVVPPINDNHNQGAVLQQNNSAKASPIELVEDVVLESKHRDAAAAAASPMEIIDTQQHLADLFGEKKLSGNNSECGPTGSSSDGGSHSDSETESSDSGSDSPNGGTTESGSDSPNSKQGSDEDVDIMTSDDDKETKNMKVQTNDPSGSSFLSLQPVETELKTETAMVIGPDPKKEGKVKMRSSPYTDKMEGSDKMEGLKRSDTVDRTHRGKHWKASDVKHLDENSECAKRQKVGREGDFVEANNDSSPVRNNRAPPHENVLDQLSKKGGYENFRSGIQKDYSKNHGKCDLDFRPPVQKPIDLAGRANTPEIEHDLCTDHTVLHANEGFPKFSVDVDNKKVLPRLPNERGIILQRELSDLEMGELREPLPEETSPTVKQFERKASSKESENRSSGISDNRNSDFGKGKPVAKTSLDFRNIASPNMGLGNPTNMEAFDKNTLHVNELTVNNERSGQIESRMCEEIGVEEHKKTPKKANNKILLQNGTGRPASHSSNENFSKKTNIFADLNDSQKDSNSLEINTNGHKRNGSSSDERSCPYSKYEKEDPELKGPINSFSQYMDYAKEYQDKYESYCSLNGILENYGNEFCKIGKDLEISKVNDVKRYHQILGLLNETYRQCGAKHKRLKKIFVVLHEELKNLKQRMKDFAAAYRKD